LELKQQKSDVPSGFTQSAEQPGLESSPKPQPKKESKELRGEEPPLANPDSHQEVSLLRQEVQQLRQLVESWAKELKRQGGLWKAGFEYVLQEDAAADIERW